MKPINQLISQIIPSKKSNGQVSDNQNQGDARAATQEEAKLKQQMGQFSMGLVSIQDIIAPEAIEVDFTYQKINSRYTRTLFISGYPRMVLANWLSPLINFPYSVDVAMHITPVDTADILKNLRRKITEMEAELTSDIRQGKITNIDTEIKLEDAKTMQEQLAKGAERFYQLGLYVTLSSPSVEELDKMTRQLQSLLGSILLISKRASLQMDEGFKTTLPMGVDKLQVLRNMDTTSLATTFPFTSSELTQDRGLVYGINEHNGSLVIFDRFTMENANMVVFAKSGAGKSYAVKLEALRQLMFGTEVLILDPEQEYQDMTESYGGEYINFSFSSPTKINPFDLSNVYEEGENELGQKIISLHALLKVMLGEMSPQEEATLDRALVATYKAKGITPDPETQTKEPPLMEDLYKALIGMESDEGSNIAARLEKYITGSFRGIFDQHTNVDIRNQLTVFSVRDIEDELRPVAMFLILDFIWTRIRKDKRRRNLVVDEAWYFMQHQDTAAFLHAMAKRARKYYLGVTTITQDVEDFMRSEYGRAIVTNSSIQLLLRQSSAAIPILADVFYLSEGEQRFLMAADIGEGLFFAGQNHIAIRVIASPEEHVVITTNPAEIDQIQSAKAQQEQMINQTTQAITQMKQAQQRSLPAENEAQPPENLPPENQNLPPTAPTTNQVGYDYQPPNQQPNYQPNYQAGYQTGYQSGGQPPQTGQMNVDGSTAAGMDFGGGAAPAYPGVDPNTYQQPPATGYQQPQQASSNIQAGGAPTYPAQPAGNYQNPGQMTVNNEVAGHQPGVNQIANLPPANLPQPEQIQPPVDYQPNFNSPNRNN